MSWGVEQLYEGEDREALRARFVMLMAKYGKGRTPGEVGVHTFQGLQDASTRGYQAGVVWATELEILERIEAYRVNGGEAQAINLPNKAEVLKQILELAQSATIGAKERIDAYKLFMQGQGLIVPPDKPGTENPASTAEALRELSKMLPV